MLRGDVQMLNSLAWINVSFIMFVIAPVVITMFVVVPVVVAMFMIAMFMLVLMHFHASLQHCDCVANVVYLWIPWVVSL